MQLVMTAGVEQEGNCPGMDESAVQCLADELALTRHNQMANKITLLLIATHTGQNLMVVFF